MIRVLYVDDEPDIREIAELALGLDPEFDVRTAKSGPEALELLDQWTPDIALFDVMMPGMDGPQLLAKVREDERWTTLPVVFVTARAQSSELHGFCLLDAAGVIAKPFDPMALALQARTFLP